MKNLIILTFAFLFVVGSAKAESFKCTFTEPFIDLKYDTETQNLLEKEAIVGKETVLEGVSLSILAGGIFQLKDKSDKQIATLTLNNNGSDGMSNTLYPFQVEYKGLVGGCSSSALKAVKAE